MNTNIETPKKTCKNKKACLEKIQAEQRNQIRKKVIQDFQGLDRCSTTTGFEPVPPKRYDF
jgi:hypothetical protein